MKQHSIGRVKVSAQEMAAVYHCISRTVNGERLLAESDREMLRRQMWQIAEYCGVKILTYALLSNHFHLLVLVPKAEAVGDAELLRRYRVLYPQPTEFRLARMEVLENKLAAGGAEAQAWREQQLAMMGDVSQFMKLLKQRFTLWYNRAHGRFGTLWAERFRSVLVENGAALRTMAAYIDLNPVRAGLAKDPKDYRFCGYAEAVAGNKKLRESLTAVMEQHSWATAQAWYRQMLYGGKKKIGAASLSAAAVEKVIREKGALSAAELLRCRVRYLTMGAVFGSRAFVDEQLRRYRKVTGRRQHTPPRLLPSLDGGEALAVLRGANERMVG